MCNCNCNPCCCPPVNYTPPAFDCSALTFTSVDNTVTITPTGSCGFDFSAANTLSLNKQNSSTVNLTGNGAGVPLQANVKISANPSNAIQVDGTGLLVVFPPSIFNTPITVLDTPSIDLTAAGVDFHSLSANVKISATAGNAIVINPDGLFVGSNAVYTDVQARAAISATAPLQYNNITGVMSIPQATSLISGYLSNTDWNTFNSKIGGGANKPGTGEPVFAGAAGTTLEFKRIKGAGPISITADANEITINATALEVDTLASVVARGNTTPQPISVQGLTISGVPASGAPADDILVRNIAGGVRIIPASTYITAETDTLDDVVNRGNTTALTIDVGGVITNSFSAGIITVTASTIVDLTHHTILVNTTTGNKIITFDPTLQIGKIIVVKKISSDLNTVTIVPLTGTIDGAPDIVTNVINQPITVQSNGTNLYTL